MLLTSLRKNRDVSKIARTVARRQADQLTLVRRRAQPAAAYITRLTATATFAYLLALLVPAGTARPVLAPLTALLVVQASLFQTIRSAVRRVISVTAGVLVAVALAATVGFTWWLLGLLIAGALVLGYLLRLGEEILEVPISAMLIFSVDSHSAATGRIVDTLVGAGAGLIAGVAFAPLRVQPARQAVGDLAGQLADLLDRMSGDLADVPDNARVTGWLTQARALRGEIERVDDALRQAEDSIRLNPRSLRLPEAEVSLRGGLETLEHAALTIRVLARSVIDSFRIASDASPVQDAETRTQLAAVLAQLAEALRLYGRLVQTLPGGNEPLESELEQHLAEAHRHQDRLADLLRPGADTSEWPLRGEILAHVDRLRTELQVDPASQAGPRARRRPVLHARRPVLHARKPGKRGRRPDPRARRSRPRDRTSRLREQRLRLRDHRSRLRDHRPVLRAHRTGRRG
jgi:uncharacterized membrane protein YgaE (UPF0421/DUF939 family)